MTPPDLTKRAPEPAPYAGFDLGRPRRRGSIGQALAVGVVVAAVSATLLTIAAVVREQDTAPPPVYVPVARGPETRLHDLTLLTNPSVPGGDYFGDVLTGCYGGMRVFLYVADVQAVPDPSCTEPGGERVAP